MPTSVGVMEGNVEEKRPLFIPLIIVVISGVLFLFLLPSLGGFFFVRLEKLAYQEFNAGDVPAHLEDRVVFLRVGKIKRVYRPRADVLLPNYT